MNSESIRDVTVVLSNYNLAHCIEPFLKAMKVLSSREELISVDTGKDALTLRLNIRKEVQEHKEG